MATNKIKQKQQRQIGAVDLESYENDGWVKLHSVGQSSILIEKEFEVEVEVPETELESIDRQMAELKKCRHEITGAKEDKKKATK